MKLKYKLIVALMILLLGGFFIFLSATQPTQQYNKISLNPSYVPSITKNINQSFNISINPPDKIFEVLSAMVVFQTYITSSPQTINLKVNEISCKNPTYIGTSSGFAQVIFDCSNVINKSGDYTFKLWSDKDIGSVVSWLDLTYINDPIGTIEVKGTEYSPDDLATIFLQLKDANGNPIQFGICSISIYFPLTNSSHPVFIKDAPMINLNEKGVYYYDLVAPSILGVYMLSSSCSYSLDGGFCYSPESIETHKPNRTSIQGTYTGDTIVLNDYKDRIYTSCSSGAGAIKYCEAIYDFDTSIHYENITNFSFVNLYYMGEASVKSSLSFWVWNYTNSSWILLPNNLTFSGGATTSPSGVNDFQSNSITYTNISDILNISSGIIKIKTLTNFVNTYFQFDNWLSIELRNTAGTIQDLKGSGEMHITNIPNATTIQVWNYTNRSLTEFEFDVVNESEVSDYVWNNTNRSLTEFNFDVVNETEITENVWNYSGNVSQNILSQFASSIWNWMGSISDNVGNFFSTKTWNSPSRNLTYTEDVVNYVKISDFVWNNTERNLTYFPSFPIQLDLTNYTLIEELIINSETNYTKLAEFVWNWTSRELTEFNFTVNATINNTELINQIWEYSNRSLTYYADMTNYTRINVGVWTYENRTLFFLYGEENGKVPIGVGKLPLTNIVISIPDPFYFDTTYTIYYDPVNMKGETVEIERIQAMILENITSTLTTPTIMTDGRYRQELTIPKQELSSFTLSVNMTQNFITTNQKAFISPEEKKGGITSFVIVDDKTKRNLLYLLFILLFLVFMFVIVGVVAKNNRKSKSNRNNRY